MYYYKLDCGYARVPDKEMINGIEITEEEYYQFVPKHIINMDDESEEEYE